MRARPDRRVVLGVPLCAQVLVLLITVLALAAVVGVALVRWLEASS